MNGGCCSRLLIGWWSCVAALTPIGSVAYMVGPPAGLDQMSSNATLVCKARVVATTIITNSSFRPISGFELRAATLEVISVLKGDPVTLFAAFEYYSPMSAGAGAYAPQHYTLETGQTYLIFATNTDVPGLFHQIRQSHTTKPDEGVTRTLDARRLNGLSIKEVHWLELNLLLTNGLLSNTLYAITQLDRMSRIGTTNRYDWPDWSATDDFSRVAVLQQLVPLVQHTNEAVAIAALKCFRVGEQSREFMRSHADMLLKIANDGPSIPRRVEAISALSGTHLSSVSNALTGWIGDPDESVRTQAILLSAEFPGEASERALAGHGVDPSTKVRAAVAEAIGNGKFDRLVPVLERLLNERGDPVMKSDPESMEYFRKQACIVFNTNSIVSSSARFALLNFDVSQTARILKENLGRAYFKPAFIRALARNDPEPWLADLADVLERRLNPTNWRAGEGSPYSDCWQLLYDYFAKMPQQAFADGKQDRYLRALETDCNSGSSHPKEIYALYRQKGLEERAAKFRAECERTFQYDIGYYFKMVDTEVARAAGRR